ncbi:MAG: hypothetical protein IIB95_04270 [Candidatus Marinimicrobia bacterium]|nr:hypothetical protein [Candidatus Neomarinimicrobiota bacterium]
MNLLSLRHILNKITIIGSITIIFLNSCTSFTSRPVLPIKQNSIEYEKMVEDQKVCRGKGTLLSKGTVSGKLSFYFTCTGEEVYIHFKDLLGRKTMLMILKPNSVEAWDIIQNIRFSTESIYLRFPFFEFVTPQDLISIFWGYEPQFQIDNKIEKESSIHITFSSNELTLDALHITMDSEKQTIDIIFDEREYGSSYPHLIKSIPSSIPQAQS